MQHIIITIHDVYLLYSEAWSVVGRILFMLSSYY